MLNSLVLHTRKLVTPHTAKGCGVNTGGVVSTVQVTTWVQVLVLQPSTAVYVIVRVRTQPLVASTLSQVTVVPQAAVVPTAGLQSGMLAGLQPRLALAGQLVKTGPVVSSTVMVWPQVAM